MKTIRFPYCLVWILVIKDPSPRRLGAVLASSWGLPRVIAAHLGVSLTPIWDHLRWISGILGSSWGLLGSTWGFLALHLGKLVALGAETTSDEQ